MASGAYAFLLRSHIVAATTRTAGEAVAMGEAAQRLHALGEAPAAATAAQKAAERAHRNAYKAAQRSRRRGEQARKRVAI
eukprot:11651900-Alexandrium_andersonii.AAC.1